MDPEMDRKYGTDHPEKIDAFVVRDGTLYLYIIQADELDGERTLALQNKLNNYLAFILDGQLEEEYPDMVEWPKVVRLELRLTPVGVAAEFLNLVGNALEAEGVGFEFHVADD